MTRFSISRVWAFARREAIELRTRHGAPGVRGARADPADDRVRLRDFAGRRAPDVRRLGWRPDVGQPQLRRQLPRLASITTRSRRSRATTSSTGACATASCASPWRSRPGSSATWSAAPSRPSTRMSTRPCRSAPKPRAATSRACTTRTSARLRQAKGIPLAAKPMKVEVRALYNQSFESVYAMVPGDIMLLLMLIPSMLTALSVVREKELGSIANFYAAPATKARVPARQAAALCRRLPDPVLHAGGAGGDAVPGADQGQPADPGRSAACIYVLASTGFGLLISVFASTQTAAIFAAAIITHPARRAVLRHVRARVIAQRRCVLVSKIFPSTYFQAISVGTFTKASAGWRCGPASPSWRSSRSSTSRCRSSSSRSRRTEPCKARGTSSISA